MTRIKNDAYMTDTRLAEAIVMEVSALIPVPVRVLEPSAGDGSFVAAVSQASPNSKIHAFDIDSRMLDGISRLGAMRAEERDFLRVGYGCEFVSPVFPDKYDLIIGNPPYSLADEFVNKSLELGVTTAFLLRTGFLHTQKRSRELWAQRKLKWLIPIAQRPSFTGDGKTDSTEYSVFIWQAHFHGDAKILKPLWWR